MLSCPAKQLAATAPNPTSIMAAILLCGVGAAGGQLHKRFLACLGDPAGTMWAVGRQVWTRTSRWAPVSLPRPTSEGCKNESQALSTMPGPPHHPQWQDPRGRGPGSRCVSHPSLWQKRELPSLGLPQETPLAKPPTTLGLSFSVFEMEGKGLKPLTKGAWSSREGLLGRQAPRV